MLNLQVPKTWKFAVQNILKGEQCLTKENVEMNCHVS